jgi:mitochondrial fission protein ELM1
MTASSEPLSNKICWIVSDGRRGIENQALGLAEAVASKLTERGGAIDIGRVIARKDGYVTLPDTSTPDLWIGCGRAAIEVARKHRRIFPDAFFTYVQDPRTQHDNFDLIVAPEHDRLTTNNAISMIGSPNRVSASQLATAQEGFRSQIDALPGPRAAVLIGGNSKRFKLDGQILQYLVARLKGLLEQDISLMITVSRRTPAAARQVLLDAVGGHERVWFYDGDGDNPYFAFLAAADWILATEESTNMLVEASSTGKPVYALPMSGSPGKFSRLHAAMEGYGSVRPYLGRLERWSYPPLDETQRVANVLIERWYAIIKTKLESGGTSQ